jgi:hypothetical protein
MYVYHLATSSSRQGGKIEGVSFFAAKAAGNDTPSVFFLPSFGEGLEMGAVSCNTFPTGKGYDDLAHV